MVVGCDSSTKACGFARITEDGTLVDTLLIRPEGHYAINRLVTIQELIPTGTWWDDVSLLVIEQQIPSRGTTGYWEQVCVAGSVIRAAVRAGVPAVLPLVPSAWRKALGWPGRKGSLYYKAYSIWESVNAGIDLHSYDEAEAYWIARAGLTLTQTKAA